MTAEPEAAWLSDEPGVMRHTGKPWMPAVNRPETHLQWLSLLGPKCCTYAGEKIWQEEEN